MSTTVERLEFIVAVQTRDAIAKLEILEREKQKVAKDATANIDVDTGKAIVDLAKLEAAKKAATADAKINVAVGYSPPEIRKDIDKVSSVVSRTFRQQLEKDFGEVLKTGGWKALPDGIKEAFEKSLNPKAPEFAIRNFFASASHMTDQELDRLYKRTKWKAKQIASAAIPNAPAEKVKPFFFNPGTGQKWDFGGAGGGGAGGFMGARGIGGFFGGITGGRGVGLASIAGQFGLLAVGVKAVAVAGKVLVPVLGAIGGGLAAGVSAAAAFGGALATIPTILAAVGGGLTAIALGLTPIIQAVSNQKQLAHAAHAVKEAEWSAAQATKAVTEARKTAARNLRDYRLEYKQSILDEESAVDALYHAQKNLENIQKGLTDGVRKYTTLTDAFTGKLYEVVTAGDKAEEQADKEADAQRAVREAQLGVTRAQNARKDSLDKLREAERKGVEGSDEVKNALHAQAQANYALKTAQDTLAKSQAGMSAEANKFTRYLVKTWVPAFHEAQKAAQEGLIPGVMTGMQKLEKLIPMVKSDIKDFGSIAGTGFKSFVDNLMSKKNMAALKTIISAGKSVFRDMVIGAKPLTDIVLGIGKAAAPMTKQLSKDFLGFITDTSKWLRSKEGKQLTKEFFKDSYKFLKLGGQIIVTAFKAIGSIGRNSKGAAYHLLTDLLHGLEGISDWFKDADNQKDWEDFMVGSVSILETLGGIIKSLGGAIFDITKDPKAIKGVEDLGRGLSTYLIPSLRDFILELGDVDWMNITAGISTFLDIIPKLFGAWDTTQRISTPMNPFAAFMYADWTKINEGVSGFETNLTNLSEFYNKWSGGFLSDVNEGMGLVIDAFDIGMAGIQKSLEAGMAGLGGVWNAFGGVFSKPIKLASDLIGDFLIVMGRGLQSAGLGGIGQPLIDWANKLRQFNKSAGSDNAKLGTGGGGTRQQMRWSGGYTGDGGKYEPAGEVHRGEFVVKKDSTARIRKQYPGALEYLNQWGRLPGFYKGGYSFGQGLARPWPAKVATYVDKLFPGIRGIGGWGRRAASHKSDHPLGLALDLMVYKNRGLGDELAAFAIKNWDALALKYIIWKQRNYRPSHGWVKMADRGSITENHFDHNHWSFLNRKGNLAKVKNGLSPTDLAKIGGGDMMDSSFISKANKTYENASDLLDKSKSFWAEGMLEISNNIVNGVTDKIKGKLGNGITSTGRGLYMTGDRGPELMYSRGGDMVLSNRELREVIAGRRNTTGNIDLEQILRRVLAEAKPDVTVQATLGGQTTPQDIVREITWSLA